MGFKHASEIYAEEMVKHGEGHGLWVPNPHTTGIPQIGDVGFFTDIGAFNRLFSHTVAPSDLPSEHSFEILEQERAFPQICPDALDPDLYLSTSVRKTKGAISGGVEEAGATVEFTCESEQGAILDIYSPADAEFLIPNGYLRSFVKRSYPLWHAYAKDKSLTRRNPIVFVYGHMRTTGDWIVTAFGGRGSGFSAMLEGGLPGVGGGGFRLARATYGNVPARQRSGPLVTRKRTPDRAGGSHRIFASEADGGDVPKGKDHTLFLRCFCVKKRLGVLRLRGGAGPHRTAGDWDQDDPTGVATTEPSDEETDSMGESDDGNLESEALEPLLDYILENSDADTAIACTDDLYLLLPSHDWPTDSKTYLQKMQPRIDVDGEKVGTISVVDAIQRKRRYMQWGLRSTGDLDNSTEVSPGEVAEGQMSLRSIDPISWPHRCFRHKDDGVISFATVSPNGKFLAVAWEDTAVILWALSDGSIIRQLQPGGHSDMVLALAFSPDSTRLISGSADSNAMIWSAKGGNGERVPFSQTGAISAVAWSPDGDWVAAGSRNANVSVYNATTGNIRTLAGHESPVTKVSFSPNGTRLVSSADMVIFVWNPRTGEKLAELSGHEFAIWAFVFSPGGDRIATASEDLTSRIWDVKTGGELVVLHEHTDAVLSVAFSPDGKEVATGSFDGTLIICDSFNGQRRHTFDAQPSSPTEVVAYSLDGSLVASGHGDGSVLLWRTQSAILLAKYIAHFGKIKSMDFTYSEGSLHLLTSSSDGTVRAWNISDTLRVL